MQSLLREPFREAWEKRWKESPKGRHLYTFTASPSLANRKLHIGLSKGKSAALVQLRTGKIGFNAFLHERNVPGINPRCQCGYGTMTVRHVLLSCPTWAAQRHQYLAQLRTLDLKKVLGTPEGVKAAVEFILATNILAQFKRVAREEQDSRREDSEAAS